MNRKHRRAVTKRARLNQRKAQHPEADLDQNWAIVAGWCAGEEELEKAKKLSHDAVIEQLGDRRTGGVQWNITWGLEATERLNMLTRDTSDEIALSHYRRLRALIREHGGGIVIAMAPGGKS